jgi:hypothetical protein
MYKGVQTLHLMDFLPNEIIDEIIVRTDFLTAIISKNDYAIGKLFEPYIHTWLWAAQNGQKKNFVE